MSIHVHVHACVVSWTQGHDGIIIPLVSGSRSQVVMCPEGTGKSLKEKVLVHSAIERTTTQLVGCR